MFHLSVGGGGRGLFFRWGRGASFLSGGCAPWEASVLMGGFEKIRRGRGGAAPIAPSMGNPERYGGFIHFHLVCTL